MIRIAAKDLKLFFADRRALLLTFLVPIALITLFALIFGGNGQSSSRAQTLVVVDEDHSLESQRIIRELDSLKEFTIRQTTWDTAQRWILKGDEPSALVLHHGVGDSLAAGHHAPVELFYDASKEPELGILKGALIGNLMRIMGTSGYQKMAIDQFDRKNRGMDSALRNTIHKEIQSNFKGMQSGSATSMNPLKSTALTPEKENSPGLIHAVAGTSIMMLLFAVASIGASLLDEKQEGTLKRLLYSPLHPNDILLGKMISTNVICIIQLVVMFVYAWIVFGLNLGTNIPSLIIMILVTAFACSSFGVVLASFARSRGQVQGFSTLIVLTMSAIGGSMAPTFIMPAFMQKIAVVSVNYWGIQGFYDIFWRHLPTSDPDFLKRVLVLLLIGIVLNSLAIRMFRRNILAIA